MTFEKIALEDLYDVHNGLSKGGQFFGKGYPFISFSTVFNNYFLPEQIVDLVQSSPEEQNNYSVRRGDIFVTRTSETANELGMSCVALKDYPTATYNGFTKRMRPKTDKVLPEYIGYYMRQPSFRAEFMAFSTMTTRASLRNEDLLGLTVLLPSIDEQRKISDILLEYDKLIKVNNKQIKLLEEAAQRIYKDWFIDCSCPRYRGSIEEHALRNTWQRKKAEDFFDITIGKTPPRAEKQWFAKSGEGIPWASISDMGNCGTYIFKSSEDITREAAKQFNMKIIPAGSILVSFKLTVGRVSIVTKEMCTNEAIAHFRVTDSQRAYAYLYLKAFEYDTLGNTSAISKAVNSKIIKAMPFVMPDDETLNEFSSIVSPILDAIYCKQAMNRELLEARDRLLPKLMNGEIEI